LLIGGWLITLVSANIGTVWIITGHLPLASFSENVSSVPGINASAPCYRGAKDVSVSTVIVTELIFRDVERHVFAACLVERAYNAALEDRPEAFNRVRVNGADDVLTGTMVDGPVLEFLTEAAILPALTGRDQADLVGNNFADERFGRILGESWRLTLPVQL
jgi:hypothetical protein